MQAEPTPQQLTEWDREIVWHSFTQMAEYEPFIIERAEKCTLIDIHGNQFIDGVSSMWCNVHGHRHPTIDRAIQDQLAKVAHVTSLGMSNPTTIKLAKRLVDIAPRGLNRVFFSDSGATAVEVALKMAFQYWQQCDHPKPAKTSYIALEMAYHGDTIGANSVGGIPRFHQVFHPLLFDVVRAPRPDTYRLPMGVTPESACSFYLEQLDQMLQLNHHRVAAIVLEPLVQCAAGMVTHPDGYLRGVRELSQRYDVFLIADEVAVGMGRTGKMFACEHEQVEPDFLCIAKGLTGGYMPVAATLTTTRVWNAFLGTYAESKPLFHGHTYGGNPLGAAAAIATLDVFEEEKTLENLSPKIARLSEHLERISHHPYVGDVRQRGLLGAIELVQDKATKTPFPWEEKRGIAVCEFALTQGVAIRPIGSVLVAMPPLSISIDELDQVLLAIEAGIKHVTEQP